MTTPTNPQGYDALKAAIVDGLVEWAKTAQDFTISRGMAVDAADHIFARSEFFAALAPTNPQDGGAGEMVERDLTMRYVNWRGVEAIRRIRPLGLSFGSTEWHPEPQWLLTAVDLNSGMGRQFALKDCDFLDAALSPSPSQTGE